MALDVPDCTTDDVGADEEEPDDDGEEELNSADDSASVPLEDVPCPEDSTRDEEFTVSADSATGDEIPDSELPSLEIGSEEIEEDDSVGGCSPPELVEESSEHPAKAITADAKKAAR